MNATLGARRPDGRRLGVGIEVGRHPRDRLRRRRSHPHLHAQRERGDAPLSRAPDARCRVSARATRCSTARSSRSTTHGRPSFERLQQRMHVENAAAIRRLVQEVPAVYMLFDLLWLDGRSVMVRAVRGPARGAHRTATDRRVVADASARGRRWRGHLRSQQAVRAGRRRRQAPRQHLRARSPLTRVGEGEAHDATGIRRRRLVARRARADGHHGFAARSATTKAMAMRASCATRPASGAACAAEISSTWTKSSPSTRAPTARSGPEHRRGAPASSTRCSSSR